MNTLCVHPCAKPPFRLGLPRQKKRRIFPLVVGKICRRLVFAKGNCFPSKSTGFYFCVSRSSDSHISGRQTFLRPNFYLLGGVCRQWPAFAAKFALMCIQQGIKLFIPCNRVLTGFPHRRTTFLRIRIRKISILRSRHFLQRNADSSFLKSPVRDTTQRIQLYIVPALGARFKKRLVLPISLLEACASREQYLWEILCHHRQIAVAALSFPAAASRSIMVGAKPACGLPCVRRSAFGACGV